jgi:hypothetical protein
VALLSSPSIPQADVKGIPTQRKRIEDTFDSLVVNYAEIPGVGTIQDTFDDVINHRRLLSGRHRQATLDARGIEDRDLFRGAIIARHIQRYHYPIPEIRFVCIRSQSHWPGDIVKLTHDKVYAGSSRGAVNATLLITARQEDIIEGEITYRALDVGVAYDRVGLIAPSARVTAWDAGSKVVTFGDVGIYTANVGPNDELPTDCSATVWPIGAEVQFQTKALAIRDSGPFTVTAVTATTVTLDATVTGLVATDVMIPARYDSIDAVQLAKWIWMADVNDTLGSAADAAYEWTL